MYIICNVYVCNIAICMYVPGSHTYFCDVRSMAVASEPICLLLWAPECPTRGRARRSLTPWKAPSRLAVKMGFEMLEVEDEGW